MTTEGIFNCAVRRNARALSTAGTPTWQYVFGFEPSLALVPGAFHGAELVFLFDMDSLSLGQVAEDQRQLQQVMLRH